MADYYIALAINGGSDSNDGLTPSTPFATIQHAYDVVRGLSNNGAGRVLQMRGGTYDQVVSNPNANGNSVQGYIKLQNYPNEVVWLKPAKSTWPGSAYAHYFDGGNGGCSYLEFDGINLDGELMDGGVVKTEATLAKEAHHIIWRNCEMLGCLVVNLNYFAPNIVSLQADMPNIGGFEFYNVKAHRGGPLGDLSYPDTWGLPEQCWYIASRNVILDGCEAYDYNGAVFQVYNHNNVALTGVRISNCFFHDIVHYMVRDPYRRITVGTVYGPHDGIQIYNTRFANCGASGASTVGLSVQAGATNPLIFNNLFVNILGYGLHLGGDGGVTGGTVRNNGAWNCAPNYQKEADAVNMTIDHNVNFTAPYNDPQFLDTLYHIASSSPFRGQGVPSGFFTTDMDGDTRGASVWDVGPDEYSSVIPTPQELFEGAPLFQSRSGRTHKGAPRQYSMRDRLRYQTPGRRQRR